MKTILGQYINDYEDIEDICFENECINNKVFSAYNVITKRFCKLKVINKKQSKFGENFLQTQIKREEEIASLCKSEYTVNLYRKLETPDHIIFEFEALETNMLQYLCQNGELGEKLDLFKYIVQQMAHALNALHKKGIIHRNINPENFILILKMKIT